jgi:hypothetical protein
MRKSVAAAPVVTGRTGGFGGRVRQTDFAGNRHFFGATFVLSCFGFLFFLSFFCELLPLPMARLLVVEDGR